MIYKIIGKKKKTSSNSECISERLSQLGKKIEPKPCLLTSGLKFGS